LPPDTPGEWLRVSVDRDCTATAFLHLQTPAEAAAPAASNVFASLAPLDARARWTAGLLRPAPFSRNLQFLARTIAADGQSGPETYYEIDERLHFMPVDAPGKVAELQRVAEPKTDYEIDAASVLVIDKDGGRWRLPKRTGAGERSGRGG